MRQGDFRQDRSAGLSRCRVMRRIRRSRVFVLVAGLSVSSPACSSAPQEIVPASPGETTTEAPVAEADEVDVEVEPPPPTAEARCLSDCSKQSERCSKDAATIDDDGERRGRLRECGGSYEFCAQGCESGCAPFCESPTPSR